MPSPFVFPFLLLFALLFLAAEVKFGTYGISGVFGAVLLSSAALLWAHSAGLSPVLPVALSIALGLIAIFQGYLALRVRRQSRLAGLEELVGQLGTTRTEIAPQGLVFVRGEYWRAISSSPIPAGVSVRVEQARANLILQVVPCAQEA